MISYTFTALTLPVTRHISASAVFGVNLYIGTRLSHAHSENLNSFPDLEEKRNILGYGILKLN